MTSDQGDTEELLRQAAQGDAQARNRLLASFRARLCQLVALRLDRRLLARVDPSDVVQEALVEADGKLDDYLRSPPIPFFPWLRRLALERLVDLHRWHIRTQKRSVRREELELPLLPDESVMELVGRLIAQISGPSVRLQREEDRQRVQAALARLSERDREVLVLRHLEQLSVKETAAVLGVSETAAKVRHVRALQRLGMTLHEEKESP